MSDNQTTGPWMFENCTFENRWTLKLASTEIDRLRAEKWQPGEPPRDGGRYIGWIENRGNDGEMQFVSWQSDGQWWDASKWEPLTLGYFKDATITAWMRLEPPR